MKKLLTLPTALLLVVILFISGCGKNDCTECCDEKWAGPWGNPATQLDPVQFPYQQYTGGVVQTDVYYYFYLPGTPQRVQFFKGETIDNVCTDEHLNIDLNVIATGVASDRPIKVFGEIYWSVFSDETVLYNSILNANQSVSGSISNVGLKQAFPEGAATVDVYINVEFESLGTLTADITYFQQHIYYFRAIYYYKIF